MPKEKVLFSHTHAIVQDIFLKKFCVCVQLWFLFMRIPFKLQGKVKPQATLPGDPFDLGLPESLWQRTSFWLQVPGLLSVSEAGPMQQAHLMNLMIVLLVLLPRPFWPWLWTEAAAELTASLGSAAGISPSPGLHCSQN